MALSTSLRTPARFLSIREESEGLGTFNWRHGEEE
jgi:hypothetical protein